MLVLGTVPILCRVKFRACLDYIVYVSIPCNVGVRVHSGPTYLFAACQFRAMYVPLLTSDQPRQEP